MNYNSNNGRSAQGSCNQTYEAFMLGNSYGVGRNERSAGMGGQRNPDESVRNCMLWPGHTYQTGNAAKLGGGLDGSGWGYEGGEGSPSMIAPSSLGGMAGNSRNRQPQPQAFLSVPGNGGQGEAQPMNIPCQVGPLGTNPSSMMKPMEAVTLKVTAPCPPVNANGVRGPMTFRISPEQLFRNQQ